MDFKHVYSMARKAPEYEGLSNKEVTIYRTAFRNGFRAGAALRQKIKKVIIPNRPADIPAGPIINNQKIAETIYNVVVDYFKVSKIELIGKARDQYLVIPRSMIANLMRECTALSFPEISRIMNRDHTSCIHYVKTRIGSSSFWKIPNNHKVYNYLKTEVLNETSRK
tara:strand:- start:184 stop:684 length:501 start_codon:yes stop_codon:yes gene_type:complete